MFKVKFPFGQREKKTQESPTKESSSQKDAPSEVDQEEALVVTISDDEGPGQEVPGTSTSKSADRKRHLEDQASESLTPKKPATEEESAPTWEWNLPTGVREEHLHPLRYETYSEDYDWVH